MLLDLGLIVAALIVGFVAGAITMFFVYRNNIKTFQKLENSFGGLQDAFQFRIDELESHIKDLIDKISKLSK
jgi:uncharacterized membrane-anchored protein YhcB (DUF1043 family)